jgi:hypothetical protein
MQNCNVEAIAMEPPPPRSLLRASFMRFAGARKGSEIRTDQWSLLKYFRLTYSARHKLRIRKVWLKTELRKRHPREAKSGAYPTTTRLQNTLLLMFPSHIQHMRTENHSLRPIKSRPRFVAAPQYFSKCFSDFRVAVAK